jgi:hypothetical protein
MIAGCTTRHTIRLLKSEATYAQNCTISGNSIATTMPSGGGKASVADNAREADFRADAGREFPSANTEVTLDRGLLWPATTCHAYDWLISLTAKLRCTSGPQRDACLEDLFVATGGLHERRRPETKTLAG